MVLSSQRVASLLAAAETASRGPHPRGLTLCACLAPRSCRSPSPARRRSTSPRCSRAGRSSCASSTSAASRATPTPWRRCAHKHAFRSPRATSGASSRRSHNHAPARASLCCHVQAELDSKRNKSGRRIRVKPAWEVPDCQIARELANGDHPDVRAALDLPAAAGGEGVRSPDARAVCSTVARVEWMRTRHVAPPPPWCALVRARDAARRARVPGPAGRTGPPRRAGRGAAAGARPRHAARGGAQVHGVAGLWPAAGRARRQGGASPHGARNVALASSCC